MVKDTKPGKDSYATLWQALCWLAYNDFDAHDPDGDGSLHQDIKLAYNTSGHKASLLEAVRDGKVSFEGRLGVHCDPPPSPGDTWREYHRTGHSSDHSSIEPKDWPSNYEDSVIGWNPSTLLTERGKFIDVRASRVIVCAWHPGPASQAVKRQIPLADQALEVAHQALEEADPPQRVPPDGKAGQEGKPRPIEQKQTKRKRDVEADALLENQIETVLAMARKEWPGRKKFPGIKPAARELVRKHRGDLNYKFSTVCKILDGTYPASRRLGIPGI